MANVLPAILAFIVVFGLPLTGQAQAPPTCHGLAATIYVSDGRIVGGPDHGRVYRGVLRGTPGDDVIVGTDGPDRIRGHAGDDTICGEDGDDIIDGGPGDDWIEGGPGHDLIVGQLGNDVINGGEGGDWIVDGHGDNRLDGGTGHNILLGGTGVDTCVNGFGVFGCDATTPQITVVNNLPTSTVCPGGNTLSVFSGSSSQQVVQPQGGSIVVTGDFTAFPGLGIQVNNWYWTSIALPVQAGSGQNPQNPDNSGAQFAISDQCVLADEPAWFGKGIPTYQIATVTAQSTAAGCTITVTENAYTNAVTPSCCSPPGVGAGTCTGPWGVTNSGQPWPPQ